MSVWLYPLYTLLIGAGIVWGITLLRRRPGIGLLFLVLTAGGLFYDSLIISLGNPIGEGDVLAALSYPRFLLHQLVLPWVIVTGVDQARRAGVGWAQNPRAMIFGYAFAGLVVVIGLLTRIVGLELGPEVLDGVLRYTAIRTAGPPLSSFLSIGFLGISGAFLWRRAGWPWLFISVVAVFLGEGGVQDRVLRMVVGSGVEVVWLWAMLATEVWLTRREQSAAKP